MRILIATGTFPPQIGGMATIVQVLAAGLAKLGHEVKVVTYSDDLGAQQSEFQIFRIKRTSSKFKNYFIFFKTVIRNGKDADLIFAQDLGSSGIPSYFASLLLPGKLVLRLGGDFLWEKVTGFHGKKIPFEKYYGEPKKGIENIYLVLFRLILNAAKFVMFNSDLQAEIYKKYYVIPASKIGILYNPVQVNMVSSHNGDLVFAGRFIKLKNIETLLRAFAELKTEKKLLLIGEGSSLADYKKLINDLELGGRVEIKSPTDARDLQDLLAKAYLAIIPSLTEMSPNLAAESLGIGTPVLITKHNGLPAQIKDKLISFNPFSVQDLTAKLEQLLHREIYENYLQKLSQIDFQYTEEQMIKECAIFLKAIS